MQRKSGCDFVGQIPPDSQKKSTNVKSFFLNFYQNIMQKRSFRRFRHIKTAELETWIKQQAKTKDLKLSAEAVSNILIQVGSKP